MPLYTITRHQDAGPHLVTLHGKVTFGRETERCRQKIKELVEAGEKRFVFDLTEVDYVDSAGVGFLVSCLTSLGQAGAKLRLATLPDRVRHVLRITKLNTVFEIFASREEALRGF